IEGVKRILERNEKTNQINKQMKGKNRQTFEYHKNNQHNPMLNGFYVLMEYMPDGLISFMKKRQTKSQYLKEKHLWLLFLQIARGVAHLHNLDPPLAHRDLKIENVLITYVPRALPSSPSSPSSPINSLSPVSKDLVKQGRVEGVSPNVEMQLKICDFGSCVNGMPKIYQEQSDISLEQDLIDRFTTPSYRAPEMIDLYQVLKFRKPLSVKVDIWALGVVLFVMAFLCHPFPDGNKMQILDAKYSIPPKHNYSKKVTKLLKLLLQREFWIANDKTLFSQICNHVQDIVNGGKGTLTRSKEIKRPQSFIVASQNAMLPSNDPAWDDVFSGSHEERSVHAVTYDLESRDDDNPSNPNSPKKNSSATKNAISTDLPDILEQGPHDLDFDDGTPLMRLNNLTPIPTKVVFP
ncbi:cyclin G associated kinase-like protein, partial [Reticulomyxa filosa]